MAQAIPQGDALPIDNRTGAPRAEFGQPLHLARSQLTGLPVHQDPGPDILERLASSPTEECHFILYRETDLVGHLQFVGSHDMVEIDTRALFREALNLGATRLLMTHNHPCGDPSPSRADVILTSRLCTIGRMMDISLIDHVIIASTGHFSFRAKGLM